MNRKDELLEFIEQREIICPLPIPWQTLYKLMTYIVEPNTRSLTAGEIRRDLGIEHPCVLHGWYVSDTVKKRRFLDHIDWAEDHGCLDVVGRFVGRQKDTKWYYGKGKVPPSVRGDYFASLAYRYRSH